MNFIIQTLKSKQTSLIKCTNWAKLLYFSLVLREREEKKPQIFRTCSFNHAQDFRNTWLCIWYHGFEVLRNPARVQPRGRTSAYTPDMATTATTSNSSLFGLRLVRLILVDFCQIFSGLCCHFSGLYLTFHQFCHSGVEKVLKLPSHTWLELTAGFFLLVFFLAFFWLAGWPRNSLILGSLGRQCLIKEKKSCFNLIWHGVGDLLLFVSYSGFNFCKYDVPSSSRISYYVKPISTISTNLQNWSR